jgi:hypothetical protein
MKAYKITRGEEVKYWKFLSTASKHYGTSYPMLARKSREAESFEYDGLKVELIEVENAFILNGQIIKIED